METIGFIGGGNMAEALVRGIISAKIYKPQQILVSDIKAERLKYLAENFHIRTIGSNKELVKKADVIILSVEPQQMAVVLEDIKNDFNKEALFISIAAGKKIALFTGYLGDIKIIRVMPNTPALIGQGVCGIYAPQNAKDKLPKALSIFSSVGKTFVLEKEELIDSITATSGSGPAYYFLLMESMIKGAVKLGFDSRTATELVIQTAKGAALLADSAQKNGQNPTQLREKIVSRGGTTEAALNTFAKGDFPQLVEKAMQNACARAGELAK
jgi:pyrroline-5-carboxylate reductase